MIEFIPGSDSQLQKLLVTRTDTYLEYNLENIVKVFSKDYSLVNKTKMVESERISLLIKKVNSSNAVN